MAIGKVVFVPGICGSVLKRGAETIWPGGALTTVFGGYPDAFVDLLATSEDLVATDILRSVPLTIAGVEVHHFDGYARALAALEQLDFRERAGTLIPFAYDWRRDIRTSAQGLKDRLSRADLRGSRIAIVAHSMGGLVSRYMLEQLGPPEDVIIDLCVLVAVPHLGAPVALQNILGNRPELFLSKSQCKEALRNSAFPSAYQLLPRLGVPSLMEASAAGFDVRDPYDTAIGQRLALVEASVAAARTLGTGLQHMGPGWTPPVRYVAIAGNAQKTVTANYVQGTGALAKEEATGGDGTVPLWSAAPPGVPVRYASATHGGMFRDDDVRAMLQAVLRPDTPGGRLLDLDDQVAPNLTVQALEPSVAVGQPIRIAVVADRPADELEALLVVERHFESGHDVQATPLHYDGGSVRSLPIDLAGVDEPAVLRCRLQGADGRPLGTETSVLVVRA